MENPLKSLKISKRKLIYLFVPIICILILSACDSSGNRNQNTESHQQIFDNQKSLSENNVQPVTSDRKIIKEGNIRFETSSVKETQAIIKKTVTDLGGYIGDENVFNYEDRIEQTVTVRVPEDKFDQLVEKISGTAERIESKNITSRDVTEEFIDVEARIKTKKDLEARYKELLKQANRVDEMLNIEAEMGKLRSEIESLEGRLNYIKNRVELSSLSITYYERVSSPFRFFSKFFQALKNGWTYLLWFIIILVSLWPFILITLIVLFIVWKYNKRRRTQR